MVTPSRETELDLLATMRMNFGEGAILAGVDEVGRGALAGPVSVGICLIDTSTSDDFPVGLRDSKQISRPAGGARSVVPDLGAGFGRRACGARDC